MAITYARVKGGQRPDLGYRVIDITLDGSYAAGGYALDNPSMGMIGNPANIETSTYVHATATNDFVSVYDPANNKLKVFKSGTAGATLNECVSGDITASHKVRCTVYGTARI